MSHETDSTTANQANTCYCFMWGTKPEYFEQRGIRRGYCGTCGICGELGHTRPHPDAPVTGAWCDACYAELSKTTPLWKVFRFAVCVIVFVWIAFLLWRG